MTIIKRAGIAKLRSGAEIGRKMLMAWDEACLSYCYWDILKRRVIYTDPRCILMRRGFDAWFTCNGRAGDVCLYKMALDQNESEAIEK